MLKKGKVVGCHFVPFLSTGGWDDVSDVARVFSGLWPHGQSQARGFSALQDSALQVDLCPLSVDVTHADVAGGAAAGARVGSGPCPCLPMQCP